MLTTAIFQNEVGDITNLLFTNVKLLDNVCHNILDNGFRCLQQNTKYSQSQKANLISSITGDSASLTQRMVLITCRTNLKPQEITQPILNGTEKRHAVTLPNSTLI